MKIPAGVEDGNKLRVKGEGDAGSKGGPVGDLYVFLGVKSHPTFKRTGKDIYSERTVRLFLAVNSSSMYVVHVLYFPGVVLRVDLMSCGLCRIRLSSA